MALTYIIASHHYREISIIILIAYMLFVCIYNILNIYHWNYNIKYCELNFKIFWNDNNV